MSTESGPARYAPLDETQRRVAEEEKQRRAEEAEKIAARGRSGNYEPLREAQRTVAEEEMSRAAARERSAAEPVVTETDRVEALMAAKRTELLEQHRLNQIRGFEVSYELRKFENQLLPEGKREQIIRAREESAARLQTGTEQNSASEEHEPASRAEMTDAQAARKARLRGIDRDIERERQQYEGNGLDRGRDSGDGSR